MKGHFALKLTLIGAIAGGLGSLSFISVAVYAQDSAQYEEEAPPVPPEEDNVHSADADPGDMSHAAELYDDEAAAAEYEYEEEAEAYEFRRAQPEPLEPETPAPQVASNRDHTDTLQGSPALSAKEIRQELEKARHAVEEARQVAEQIVADAQQQANLIRQDAVVNDAPTDLGPVEVQTHRVAVEIASGTVEEIATAIMPGDWRVMVDVKDQAVLQRRFQYVSTKSRDQALRDLLGPVGLRHQYFFDLKDAQGVKSPLLVISKR
ncbi:MAG: hypothetical protein WBA20_00280 [Ketobacter sp.]